MSYYYLLEKENKHTHTTSLKVCERYVKNGYVLIGTLKGIDIKIRWCR